MSGELPAWGFYVRHASRLTYRNIKMILTKQDFRPALVFDDVDGLKMNQVNLPAQEKKHIILHNTRHELLDSKARTLVKKL